MASLSKLTLTPLTPPEIVTFLRNDGEATRHRKKIAQEKKVALK